MTKRKLDFHNMKNPFKISNSNFALDEYWINPFNKCIKLTEEEFINDVKPIIFIGAKGCGKTTLLKHYSYESQRNMLKRNNSTLNTRKNNIFFGIYLDFNKDVLQYIDKVYEISIYFGDEIFDEYIKVNFFIQLFDILSDLSNSKVISKECIEIVFREYFKSISIDSNSFETANIHESLKSNFFYKIKHFKDEYYNEKKPRINIDKLIDIIKNYISFAKNAKFLLLLDDYEKYSVNVQKYINFMMKYIDNRSQYTIRSAKANNDFKTYDTINKNEYLRSGSDYKEVHFLNIFDMIYFKSFAKEVCNKLLEINGISSFSIESILGARENFIQEAVEIVDGRKKHFEILLKNSEVCELNKIKYPQNPLIEMMNILYVIRYKELDSKGNLDKYDITRSRMLSFLKKENNDYYRKYKNDFANKYRLSLLILLSKLYGVKKKYYSFNTLAYLVSGNLTLLKKILENIWDEAMKNNWDGSVPINCSFQSVVTYRTLTNEINRLEKEKPILFNMLSFLGEAFQKYHFDYKVKYPETNQFSFRGKMSEYLKEIIDEAILEGVLFKKKNLQQKSIGLEKGEIFLLNRIFAPEFQLSYRIRGGYIVRYKCDDFETVIRRGLLKFVKNFEQLSLFNNEEVKK